MHIIRTEWKKKQHRAPGLARGDQTTWVDRGVVHVTPRARTLVIGPQHRSPSGPCVDCVFFRLTRHGTERAQREPSDFDGAVVVVLFCVRGMYA